jgi:hypothetical protein
MFIDYINNGRAAGRNTKLLTSRVHFSWCVSHMHCVGSVHACCWDDWAMSQETGCSPAPALFFFLSFFSFVCLFGGEGGMDGIPTPWALT